MKQLKPIVIFMASVVLLLFCSSCKENSLVYRPTIKVENISLQLGEKVQIDMLIAAEPVNSKVDPDDIMQAEITERSRQYSEGYDVLFKFKDNNIIRIEDGMIEALAEGETAVVAELIKRDNSELPELDGTVYCGFQVRVMGENEPYVKVEPVEITLDVDETYQLDVETSLETDYHLSGDDILSVDEQYVVTAHHPGTAFVEVYNPLSGLILVKAQFIVNEPLSDDSSTSSEQLPESKQSNSSGSSTSKPSKKSDSSKDSSSSSPSTQNSSSGQSSSSKGSKYSSNSQKQSSSSSSQSNGNSGNSNSSSVQTDLDRWEDENGVVKN